MTRHSGLTAADPAYAKKRSTWEVLQRVAVYLRPYRALALATIACALLTVLCSFAYPKLTEYIIDQVIGHKQANLLIPSILMLLGAFLLRDIFDSLRIRVNNILEQNVVYDMRREVYGRLQRLPVGYFDQRASGDLMTRVIEDVNSVERVLIDGTEQGAVAILSIFGVLAIMFYTNPMLTWLALVPIPILSAGALWYTLTAHKRYRVQREASSAMNALLMDNLQGIRQIKAFGRQQHEDVRFAERAEKLREGTLLIMRAWANYSPAMKFVASAGSVLVLWYGGQQVLADKMTVGELVSFLLFLGLFYDPVNRLHGLNQMMQAARAAGERVFDIMDATPERSGDAARHGVLRTPVQGEVVYENVSFGYGPEKVVLKGVNLHAKPGQMIALVGPTGAGKSTLVNLLPCFYEATGGRILIDGQDVSGIALESLREHISVVSQEPFLFNGTIRENILYGRLDATEADLVAAAKAANCYEFISRLPEGFDAKVGERGVKLSVGEKQRVSIARAILKNSPILILDEATASVDTATEKLIQEAFEHLMAGRTSFVIAHRLSTIRNADQILVVKQGEIIERGTHEELLDKDGLYAKLARIQDTRSIEEGFEKLQTT